MHHLLFISFKMESFYCLGINQVINIGRVLITKPIAVAIKNGIGAESFTDVRALRHYAPKMSPDVGFSAPLNRIDDMVDIMWRRVVPLPPIEVRRVASPDGDYYDIVNGRHRLAASVILGYNAIPIVVV